VKPHDDLKLFARARTRWTGNHGPRPSGEARDSGVPILSEAKTTAARATISQWPDYDQSPLIALPGLASTAGVGQIFYKDEANRFGLGSFKALGGAYAVYRVLADYLERQHGLGRVESSALLSGIHNDLTRNLTVASATDGNHGRSVAWGARLFGCECTIYIHAGVSKGREQALLDLGARVVRITGNYDESVRLCAEHARRDGMTVVSDTSWEGYRDIPTEVMAGYSVMASELIEQLGTQTPTHVFVQGGVGGIAATLAERFDREWGDDRPSFVVTEPETAACLFESAAAGRRTSVDVTEETLMAGLSCGDVSHLAWPVLSRLADHFITVEESLVAPAMKLLALAPYGDEPIVAGESAVPGLAGFLAAATSPTLAERMGIGSESRIVLIGTEGATDPRLYQELTGLDPASVAVRGHEKRKTD